jgi:hypothetical protein
MIQASRRRPRRANPLRAPHGKIHCQSVTEGLRLGHKAGTPLTLPIFVLRVQPNGVRAEYARLSESPCPALGTLEIYGTRVVRSLDFGVCR